MNVRKLRLVRGLGAIWLLLTGAFALALGLIFVQWFSYTNRQQGLANFLAQPVSLQQTREPASKEKTQANTLFSNLSDLLGADRSQGVGEGGIVFNSAEPNITTRYEESDLNSEGNSTSDSVFQKVLVSEVLIEGDNSKHEFVELFNPNNSAIDLFGWELRKKSSSGSDSVLVSSKKFLGTIKAKGYFLISHPEFQNQLAADLVWSSSSYGLSKDNTVYLLDSTGRLVDKLGWGLAPDYEGQASVAPGKEQSLSRRSETDMDNNLADFVLSDPSAQNSSKTGSFLAPLFPSPSPTDIVLLTPSTQAVSDTPSPVPSPSQTQIDYSSPSPIPSSSPSPAPSPTIEAEASPSAEIPLPSIIPDILALQITNVQFDLGEDYLNADFVELYNPNPFPITLEGYKLVKKTAGGIEYNLNYEWKDSDLAPANSKFYWVSSKYPEKSEELKNQGLVVFERDQTITAANTIILKYLKQDIDVW